MVEVEFWRGYQRKTGNLTWRPATPDDLPAIRRLRNISERFLHTAQSDPCLFEFPVLLALVAEDEEGRVRDCIYLEAQVELVKMACTRHSIAEGVGIQEDVAYWLRRMGFRTVWARNLRTLTERMRAGLERLGFHPQDEMCFWRRRL